MISLSYYKIQILTLLLYYFITLLLLIQHSNSINSKMDNTNTNTNTNTNMSIYIPRIDVRITEQMICDEFRYTLGIVERVDFTPIGKRPGFEEADADTLSYPYVSAFVHFHTIFYDYSYIDYLQREFTVVVNQIFSDLEQGKMVRYYHHFTNTASTSCNSYWNLLKNKSPIQRTLMNTHQIVANGLLLERRVDILEPKLDTIEFNGHENRAHIDVIYERLDYQTERADALEKENKKLAERLLAMEEKLCQLSHHIHLL